MTITSKSWERYARALDMRLEGKKLDEIGKELGVSRQRAHQLAKIGGRQLAHRVFYGVPAIKRQGGTGAYSAMKPRDYASTEGVYWYVDGWIKL